jgi:hypothetical protein
LSKEEGLEFREEYIY